MREDINAKLFSICCNSETIDKQQVQQLLLEGADANSLHPWAAFENMTGERQSKYTPLHVLGVDLHGGSLMITKSSLLGGSRFVIKIPQL